LWSDLNAKRRAAQQTPNDANARAALGSALRQLALPDTPRRDSFYAQAMAELETAVRLDANHRVARQTLAAIYEARAGAATGPRNVAYVQLAVEQWQVLAASDANARKHLAEDVFYLGLDAQTRGAFADAVSYYDRARGLMPNGAGPLFTLERADAQRKLLNVAWARALLNQNEPAPAADKARAAFGEAFAAMYQPPAFYVARAQVTMSPGARTIAFSLAPLQGQVTRQAFTRVIEAWRQVGVGAELAGDGGTLNLTIAFANTNDLMNKLDALTRATPNEPDWALVRAVLAPKKIEWRASEDWWWESLDYREQVDLGSACTNFSGQLASLAPNLATFAKASPQDDEAQLKRALLESAQSGWRNALAQGRVVYRAGENEVRVEACGARQVAITASPLRGDVIALAASVLGVLGIALGVLAFRGMMHRRGDAAKK
jgi:tetratricopeptide (TPR) repeat protein